MYWQAFNPGRWFFTGDSSLLKSTRTVGFFLMPVAVLLPVGVAVLLQRRRSEVAWLLLLGVLTAPLPSVLVAQDDIGRWLVVVPFVCLIAAVGADHLWHMGRRAMRLVVMALLLAMGVQFWYFHADYTSDYGRRAGVWFGGNTRDAVRSVLFARSDSVLLSEAIPHVDAYWAFYARTDGESAPTANVGYVPQGHLPQPVSGSAAFLTPALDESSAAALREMGWTMHDEIRSLDGEVSFLVWVSTGTMAAPPESPQ